MQKDRIGQLCRSNKHLARTRLAIGKILLRMSKEACTRDEKATILLHGIEPVLLQDDKNLLSAYIKACASVSFSFTSGRVLADIVASAEDRILERGPSDDCHVLEYCAMMMTKLDCLQEAMDTCHKILRHTGLPMRNKIIVSGLIGHIYSRQGLWAKAISQYSLVIGMIGQRPDLDIKVEVLHQMGIVLKGAGKLELSLKYLAYSRRLGQRIGSNNKISLIYHHIGDIKAKMGRWRQAIYHYQKALAWLKEEAHHEPSLIYFQMATIYANMRKWKSAFMYYEMALSCKYKKTSLLRHKRAYKENAGAIRMKRDYKEAIRSYYDAYTSDLGSKDHWRFSPFLPPIETSFDDSTKAQGRSTCKAQVKVMRVRINRQRR